MTTFDYARAFFEAKARELPPTSAAGELARELSLKSLTPLSRHEITDRYGLTGNRELLGLLLDWVIDYVRGALAEEPLASQVANAVEPINRALGIKEGDFFEFRAIEIKEILLAQLELILEDGELDDREELAQASLQRAFGLSYDQYLTLTRPLYESALDEIRLALARATPEDRPRLAHRQLSLRAVCELAVVLPRSLGGLK